MFSESDELLVEEIISQISVMMRLKRLLKDMRSRHPDKYTQEWESYIVGCWLDDAGIK